MTWVDCSTHLNKLQAVGTFKGPIQVDGESIQGPAGNDGNDAVQIGFNVSVYRRVNAGQQGPQHQLRVPSAYKIIHLPIFNLLVGIEILILH